MSPLRPDQPLAIYMEGALGERPGKMGYGVLRYSPNPIACVIDSRYVGQDAYEFCGIRRPGRKAPVVGTVAEAIERGAQVFVLGIAPGGGSIPPEWFGSIDEAVAAGLDIVNGLHDRLGPRYPRLAPGQFVWDIRVEPANLTVGTGAARQLSNRRVLMVGTDMAVGKMTAGLEIERVARESGLRSAFVATGQIGITITGRGVPLDAIRLDFASGAIEREVMNRSEAELVVIEGQGSLLHPASSATLPLIRGSCPTHLVLCHRAGMETLLRVPWVRIPPLVQLARLYEDVAEAVGTYYRPRCCAIALDTSNLGEAEAERVILETEADTGLPVADPIRQGPERLREAILAAS